MTARQSDLREQLGMLLSADVKRPRPLPVKSHTHNRATIARNAFDRHPAFEWSEAVIATCDRIVESFDDERFRTRTDAQVRQAASVADTVQSLLGAVMKLAAECGNADATYLLDELHGEFHFNGTITDASRLMRAAGASRLVMPDDDALHRPSPPDPLLVERFLTAYYKNAKNKAHQVEMHNGQPFFFTIDETGKRTWIGVNLDLQLGRVPKVDVDDSFDDDIDEEADDGLFDMPARAKVVITDDDDQDNINLNLKEINPS